MAFSFGGATTNAFGGGAAASANAQNPNGDVKLPGNLADTVQCIQWSPVHNFVACGGWDNKVLVYEVQQGADNKVTNAAGKASYDHQGPVLDLAWKKDGKILFSGGCDNQVIMYDAASQQKRVIGKHDAPVKSVFYLETNSISNMVVTGSWDKTLRYWDIRQPREAMKIALPERVYCMDVCDNLMVVALAGKRIQIYDVTQPQKPFRELLPQGQAGPGQEASPLKYQSRCVACFKDKSGFALGSIEGRVAIHHVQSKDKSRNFIFKCHRVNKQGSSEVYPINNIAFHPLGTFATAGADGSYNFWDKDSKQRLKPFKRCDQPITCAAWNQNGTLYAYGVGYDWHKGSQHHNPASTQNRVMIHVAQASEIRPRTKK